MTPDRLERLLKIRRAGEGVERGRWSRARQEVESLLAGLKNIEERRDHVTDELRARGLGPLDLALLQASAENREALSRTAVRAEAGVRESEGRAEERRRHLEAAGRAVKVVEKLCERSAAGERARRAAEEIRDADDRPAREGDR